MGMLGWTAGAHCRGSRVGCDDLDSAGDTPTATATATMPSVFPSRDRSRLRPKKFVLPDHYKFVMIGTSWHFAICFNVKSPHDYRTFFISIFATFRFARGMRLSGVSSYQSLKPRAICRRRARRGHGRRTSYCLRRAGQFFPVAFFADHERLCPSAGGDLHESDLRRCGCAFSTA